jgi:BMFP domain-containing protein YqiC
LIAVDMDIDTTEVDREITKMEQRITALDAKLMPDRTVDGTIMRASVVAQKELIRLKRKRGDILGGKPQTDVTPAEPATPPPAVLREPFRITPTDVVRKRVDTGVPASKELQNELNTIFEKHAEADAIAWIEDEFHRHLQNCKDIKADRDTRYSQGAYISMLMVLARMNVETNAIAEFQRNRRVELQKRIAALESQLAFLQARSDEGRKLSKTIRQRRDKDGNLVADVFVEAPPLSVLEERIANLEARPTVKYLGVWKEGKSYVSGSMVTDRGSVWHCARATMQRPGSPPPNDDWVLACKRGQDGKGVR